MFEYGVPWEGEEHFARHVSENRTLKTCSMQDRPDITVYTPGSNNSQLLTAGVYIAWKK